MPWLGNLLLALTSGLLVPAIVAFVRIGWNRRKVPTALARSVRRENYLSAVLTESEQDGVTGLDVLAPRLIPAAEGKGPIGAIQAAWERIDGHQGVRVVTLDSDNCVKAGAELLVKGIEVRVAQRGTGAEHLSYHLFKTGLTAVSTTALINHHQGGKDRPVRLRGVDPIQAYRDHFSLIWGSASPLESLLAQRIVAEAGRERSGTEKGSPPDRAAVLSALATVSTSLGIDQDSVERVLPHLAFRHGSPVIFVVGLPGSGKSTVRRKLAEFLESESIRTAELTDYVYAYRDLIHKLLKLDPPRGEGFEAEKGGAFSVRQETDMAPALQALARTVRDRVNHNEVTLVEFARSDLAVALHEFDDDRLQFQVIYVSAPAQLRAARIARRAEQPQIVIEKNSIKVVLSDNHLLPSSVERDIYALDDFVRLSASPRWRDRIFTIENDADDNGAQIEARLREFVDKLVSDYRPPPPADAADAARLTGKRAARNRNTVSTSR